MGSATMDGAFRFMDLPPELRDEVYTYLLLPEDNSVVGDDGITIKYRYDLRFYRTCRTVYNEAKQVFRMLPWNTFARIETPWEEAESHVSVEGMVPVLASGQAANNFKHIHLRIIIDAPRHTLDEDDNKKFIVFVNDLERFTKMWMYSDLSYSADLNPHLRLRLLLKNPSVPNGEDYIKMSKDLQRKILLPFGFVKNLRDVKVLSVDPGVIINKDIEQEMRKMMATQYEPAETCLDKSKKLLDEGDQLAEGVEPDADGKGGVVPNYHGAIEKYVASFEAMHIVCVKRRRAIWGDAWFDRFLTFGHFAGKHGQIVRLTMRVELVSAVTNCYYQLGISSVSPDSIKYLKDSRFWGQRTIQLMREHVSPNDIPHENFPREGKKAMGRIYLGAGMAGMELVKQAADQLEEIGGPTYVKHEAKRWLIAARRWCPNDDEVERGLWRYGLA